MSTVAEIAPGIFRLHASVRSPGVPGGFSYNQYLVLDDEPLLFHTGSRQRVDEVAAAIERVVPLTRLRHIAFSHWEQDECGGLDGLLARAPQAQPVCSRVNAMVNRDGMARPPRAMQEGEVLAVGRHRLRWFETPHLPHGWESGLFFEETTRRRGALVRPGRRRALRPPLAEPGAESGHRRRSTRRGHGRRSLGARRRPGRPTPRVVGPVHAGLDRRRGRSLRGEHG